MGGAACGGGCGVDITGAMFNAFAAAGGISRPVPSANLNINCNLKYDRINYEHYCRDIK